MSLFTLRGELSRPQSIALGIAGLIIFLLAWWGLAELFSEQKPIIEGYETRLPSAFANEDSLAARIDLDSLARADSAAFANAKVFEKVYPLLPPPQQVFASYPGLIQKDELLSNTWRSVWLNIQGYFWAMLISIPLGFLIGLLPLFRGLFSKQVDALRYLPLTALTGIFIICFGIEDEMKIAFLAFGIIVYLLPVVVQRIDEVQDVYLQTVYTLGATSWQTINGRHPGADGHFLDLHHHCRIAQPKRRHRVAHLPQSPSGKARRHVCSAHRHHTHRLFTGSHFQLFRQATFPSQTPQIGARGSERNGIRNSGIAGNCLAADSARGVCTFFVGHLRHAGAGARGHLHHHYFLRRVQALPKQNSIKNNCQHEPF